MRIRVSRRGIAIGIVFCIAAIASGIFVIKYTEAFFLVVIFWIAAPLVLLQFVRWARRAFRRK